MQVDEKNLLYKIKQLIRKNLDEVTNNSYLDAHAVGLHSLMVINKPDARVRMFFADHNHQMWFNDPDTLGVPLSIGFHSHNRHIQIRALKGVITNWVIAPVNKNQQNHTLTLSKFAYNSQIIHNDGCRFSHIIDNCTFITKRLTTFASPSYITLDGNELHTVYVPRNQTAAWLVIEGAVNKQYEPVCYSNRRLDQCSFDHLYKRPTQSDILHIVDNVF